MRISLSVLIVATLASAFALTACQKSESADEMALNTSENTATAGDTTGSQATSETTSGSNQGMMSSAAPSASESSSAPMANQPADMNNMPATSAPSSDSNPASSSAAVNVTDTNANNPQQEPAEVVTVIQPVTPSGAPEGPATAIVEVLQPSDATMPSSAPTITTPDSSTSVNGMGSANTNASSANAPAASAGSAVVNQ